MTNQEAQGGNNGRTKVIIIAVIVIVICASGGVGVALWQMGMFSGEESSETNGANRISEISTDPTRTVSTTVTASPTLISLQTVKDDSKIRENESVKSTTRTTTTTERTTQTTIAIVTDDDPKLELILTTPFNEQTTTEENLIRVPPPKHRKEDHMFMLLPGTVNDFGGHEFGEILGKQR